ncbi:porin family protein [Niabella hirudinis]|uniref:porin family protein n=1 Tax=Niabella hirudinis TaxID=1285929 RepID=UPI003EBF93F2
MKQSKLVLKSLLVAAAVMVAGTVSAQVAVGVRAGVNLSNLTIKDADGKTVDGAKLTPGFNAGLTFDIPVADEFYVQPGALFSMKGAKLEKNAHEYFNANDYAPAAAGDYTRLNTYNLEVPVNFIFKPAAGNGNLLIGAGPYFSYALGGNFKRVTDAYGTETGKLEFANDYNDFSSDADKMSFGKRADVGANLLFGYEFMNRFSVQLNGQLGLTNLEPKSDGKKPEEVLKNNNFGLSIGYKF